MKSLKNFCAAADSVNHGHKKLFILNYAQVFKTPERLNIAQNLFEKNNVLIIKTIATFLFFKNICIFK